MAFYGIYQEKKRNVIHVTVPMATGRNKRVSCTFNKHSIDVAKMLVLQKQHIAGIEEWGKDRWPYVRDYGAAYLYDTTGFGATVRLGLSTVGTLNYYVDWYNTALGLRTTNSFATARYGHGTAKQLAELQASFYRAANTYGELCLPIGIVRDLVGDNYKYLRGVVITDTHVSFSIRELMRNYVRKPKCVSGE
jgi:hypothetical protein